MKIEKYYIQPKKIKSIMYEKLLNSNIWNNSEKKELIEMLFSKNKKNINYSIETKKLFSCFLVVKIMKIN